jgi:hypothetical protein
MQDIEERLRQPVPVVNPDMTLPADIAKRISSAADSGGAAYGQHKEGDESTVHSISLTADTLLAVPQQPVPLYRDAMTGSSLYFCHALTFHT